MTGRAENLRGGLAMQRCISVLRTIGLDFPVAGAMVRIDDVQIYRVASFRPVKVRDYVYCGRQRFYDRSESALRKRINGTDLWRGL